MGIGKFQPLQNRYLWTDQQKSRHNWLRPREDPLYQIWYKSTHWELLGKCVKYNKKIIFYLYLFFSGSRTGQTRGWIFTRDSSKDVKSRKDEPFGSLNDVPLNFGGKTPEKTEILGAWIGLSSLDDKKNPYNLKTT